MERKLAGGGGIGKSVPAEDELGWPAAGYRPQPPCGPPEQTTLSTRLSRAAGPIRFFMNLYPSRIAG